MSDDGRQSFSSTPRDVPAEQIVREAQDWGAGPSLLAMAGSLVGSVVAHAADGFRQTPADAHAARLEACRSCPRFDAGSIRCDICGCYLQIKLGMASSSCPDDPPKWGPV